MSELERQVRARSVHYLSDEVARCGNITLGELMQIQFPGLVPLDADQIQRLGNRMGLTARYTRPSGGSNAAA
jgi:hypothetical protein